MNEEDVRAIPMGVYWIGAVLKENQYDVEIVNLYDAGNDPNFVKRLLKEKRPDVIGFSLLHANRWGAIEIARIAKELNSDVQIVFGGIGATFLWEHLLTHFREIDFIVLGEGEYTFLELVGYMASPSGKEVDQIKGIAYKKGDQLYKTEPRPFITDLDTLPIPAKYFDYYHIALTRGCPCNCTFCGSPAFWKRTVRFHSADYFVAHIRVLSEKGIRFLYISDDTFTFKPELVIDICRKIIQQRINISWVAISRVNYVSEEMLYWMRCAGCIQISYGVESGSERIRHFFNKNITTRQIKNAFKLTTSFGILARAYFIYGAPGENRETIQATIDLMDEIKPLSVLFYILDIFPGTKLYEAYKERTRQTDDVWLQRIEDIMYFETDESLSREDVRSFGKTLRHTLYSRLHAYIDAIRLVDNDDMHAMHADFFSKLAMTFSHGDYAQINAIKHKDEIATKLYQRALTYFPDHRAFLGLGILEQKRGAYSSSVHILQKGLEYYPNSPDMTMCLGISYFNCENYSEALICFQAIEDRQDVANYIAMCRAHLQC